MGKKLQAIKYKCCGKIHAISVEPDCYTDEDWLKNLKEYVLRGDIVEMIERCSNWELEECKCKENQLNLGI